MSHSSCSHGRIMRGGAALLGLTALLLLPLLTGAKATEWQTYLADNFADTTVFPTGQFGEAFYSVDNGEYVIDGRQATQDSLSALTDNLYYYYVEAQCRVTDSTAGELAFAGLVFHYKTTLEKLRSYYVFYVYPDGYYGAKRVIGDDVTIVLPLARSTEIDTHGPNTLAVDAQGTRFDLYINGKYVNGFTDVRIDGGGFGFYVSKLTAGSFDNFKVKVERKAGGQEPVEMPEEKGARGTVTSGDYPKFDIPKDPDRPTYPWEVGGKKKHGKHSQPPAEPRTPSKGDSGAKEGPVAPPEPPPPDHHTPAVPEDEQVIIPPQHNPPPPEPAPTEPAPAPKPAPPTPKPVPPPAPAEPPPADTSSGSGADKCPPTPGQHGAASEGTAGVPANEDVSAVSLLPAEQLPAEPETLRADDSLNRPSEPQWDSATLPPSVAAPPDLPAESAEPAAPADTAAADDAARLIDLGRAASSADIRLPEHSPNRLLPASGQAAKSQDQAQAKPTDKRHDQAKDPEQAQPVELGPAGEQSAAAPALTAAAEPPADNPGKGKPAPKQDDTGKETGRERLASAMRSHDWDDIEPPVASRDRQSTADKAQPSAPQQADKQQDKQRAKHERDDTAAGTKMPSEASAGDKRVELRSPGDTPSAAPGKLPRETTPPSGEETPGGLTPVPTDDSADNPPASVGGLTPVPADDGRAIPAPVPGGLTPVPADDGAAVPAPLPGGLTPVPDSSASSGDTVLLDQPVAPAGVRPPVPDQPWETAATAPSEDAALLDNPPLADQVPGSSGAPIPLPPQVADPGLGALHTKGKPAARETAGPDPFAGKGGLVKLTDDFSKPRWPESSSAGSNYSYAAGAYDIDNLRAQTMAISFQEERLGPVRLECAADFVGGEKSVGFGLAVRFSNSTQGISYYGLFVSEAGECLLLRVTQGQEKVLADWKASAAYRPGQRNVLRLDAVGGKVVGYVNGQLAVQAKDNILPAGGYALLAGPGVSIRYDDLSLTGLHQ